MLGLEEGVFFSAWCKLVLSQAVALHEDTLHIFWNLPHKLSVLVDVHSTFKWFTHLCSVDSVSHISLIKCLGPANFSLAVYIQKCAFGKASAFAHGSSLIRSRDPARARGAEELYLWWFAGVKFVHFSRCNRISHICKLGPSYPAKQNLALENESWLTPRLGADQEWKDVLAQKSILLFKNICRTWFGDFFPSLHSVQYVK